MAVLKVKFDNIICFNDFEADFTYPKKLVKTPLDNEFLLNYPNIRYKKVNILKLIKYFQTYKNLN